MIDVKIRILEKVLWLQRATTDTVNGLVVELKFLDLFLVRNIAWWSGLVVDVKEQRPQNIMLLKWAHTHSNGQWFNG